MNKDIENPPAFPKARFEHNSVYDNEGMTLRDWFAGKTLSGLLADPDYNQTHEFTATYCYQIADAMLKARQS